MGEDSSNKKRKIVLDWDKLLDSHDDAEPPPLVVTITSGEGDRSNLESLTDSKLEESIVSSKSTFETVAHRLPDKGKKIKDTILSFEREKERREKYRWTFKDGSGSEMPTQSQSSSIKGTSTGFKKVAPLSSQPQSQFGSIFCQKVEGNQENRTTGAFGNELNALGRCDRRKTGLPGHVSSKENCRTGLSSRQRAFQSPRFLSGDVERHDASNGGIHSTPSSSDMEEDPSVFSSRRNPLKVHPLSNFRPKNVQTVVLVDEEYQHVDKIDEEERTDESMKENKIYFPSRDHPESVEICYADMECLAPETYLSSTIMNFYIRYLQQPTFPAYSDKCSYHFFNTYFYEKLKEAVQNKANDMEKLYAKFRRWWKGVNIFEKAYIFLPIHENHHWSLVIICIPDKEDESGPILLHLDSLGLHSSRSVFENIRRFLKKEWTYLNEKEMSSNYHIADRIWKNLPRRIEEKVITVPQQRNEYDCGLFVLFFIRRFIEEAPQRLKKKDLAMFGKQWFNPKEASDLRPQIRALLKKMFMENRGDRSTD